MTAMEKGGATAPATAQRKCDGDGNDRQRGGNVAATEGATATTDSSSK